MCITGPGVPGDQSMESAMSIIISVMFAVIGMSGITALVIMSLFGIFDDDEKSE